MNLCINPFIARIRAIPIILLVTSLHVLPCAAQTTRPASAKEIRILFIGNSLTYVNDLPAELQAMATAAYPKLPPVHCESVVAGGATLERHWNFNTAAKRIAEGGWDYVVLQEQSQAPIIARDNMFKYARLFDAEVKKSGAKTVLYMTWPRRQRPEDIKPLADAYNTLGKELGAIVIPVGTAWHQAQADDPKLDLYNADGIHPSPAGTWLAACCLAEVLRGAPDSPFPRKIVTRPGAEKSLVDIEETEAAELQKAAETVLAPAR